MRGGVRRVLRKVEGERDAVERVRAGAGAVTGQVGDDLHEHVPEPADVLGEHPEHLGLGDALAFLDAGGYTESCAARYNAQLLPASVLVSRDRAEIITEREQLKDIAGRFRVPPRLLAASFAPQV